VTYTCYNDITELSNSCQTWRRDVPA